MKANYRGFSSTGLLIIVAIIGLAGSLTWIYYSSQHSDSGNNETTKEQSIEIEPLGETANWKSQTIDRYKISYKYPDEDGWVSSVGVVDSTLPGHEANININYTECGPNCGFALSVGVFDKKTEEGYQENFAEEQMSSNAHYTLTSKQAVTVDDTNGTRWEYAPENNDAAIVVYYYFTKDDFSYTLTVNNNGAKTEAVDITAIGEKIVGTLQFIE